MGNGDISNMEMAKIYSKKYGLDGVVIGRAVLKNPWFFSEKGLDSVSIEERLATLIDHVKLFNNFYQNKKNFHDLRKFYAAYLSGFNGAKKLRMQLMPAENAKEIAKVVAFFIAENKV